MKKILFLLLSGAIFGACSSDKNRVPVFVKNVVMPPDSWVFTPGDGVTVSAEGFESDDEIMLEIYWTDGSGAFAPEGYAKGVRGIVSSRTATGITFLAPGHYPASTVRVLLLRRGRMMPLGKIRVADGQPGEAALYGLSVFDTDETRVDRIDPATGGVTPVKTLGVGRGIACPVGVPGSGWIYGLYSGSAVGVDLTMKYWNDFGFGDYLFAGLVSDSSVGFLNYDSGRLTLTTQTVTRTSPVSPVSWQIPGEVVQTLAVQPFVQVGSELLLAQRNADGTCAPLVLRVYGGSGSGEAVGADAMIPFRTVAAPADEPEKLYQVGGYAVSVGGKTQLRLFNAAGDGAFGETLAEVPGTALSVTEYAPDKDSLEIYLLCEADGTRRIHVYDALKKTQRTLPGGVTLVAVSKTHPAEAIREAYDAGHRVFGESRPQELREKHEALPKDIEWHMIGHLQTNKIKYIAPFVALIHSVDSARLAEAIQREAAKCGRTLEILLEIRVAEEETKTGWDMAGLMEYVRTAPFARMPNVCVRGVMGIATNTDDGGAIRRDFMELKRCFELLQPYFGPRFNTLSMGMSHDYPLAVECGSTMVRVGSLIFGRRGLKKPVL